MWQCLGIRQHAQTIQSCGLHTAVQVTGLQSIGFQSSMSRYPARGAAGPRPKSPKSWQSPERGVVRGDALHGTFELSCSSTGMKLMMVDRLRPQSQIITQLAGRGHSAQPATAAEHPIAMRRLESE